MVVATFRCSFSRKAHLYFFLVGRGVLCLSEPGAGYVGQVVGQGVPDVYICFFNTGIIGACCHGQLFCLGSGDQTPVFMPVLQT